VDGAGEVTRGREDRIDEPAPFAIAPDGGTLAAGDGPELLVWRGDGAPAWKRFTDGILVGVAVGSDLIVTVDSEGRLVRWRRTDGEQLDLIQLDAPRPAELRLGPGGVIGVLCDTGVVVLALGQAPSLVAAPGASAFGFGPGGASVGIGTGSGQFTAIELATGAAWGSLELPAGVRGVDWSALGHWLVGADRMLYRVKGDATAVEAAMTGADTPIDAVRCSESGLIAAARTEDRVELYELHTNRPIGEFVLRRRIGGIAFGSGLALAIGLDDGDGNVVELGTGASFRTEPHPGRGRNTWRLKNKVDLAAVRGALALAQAGGEPIARYVAPPPAEGEEGGSGGGCLGGCLAAVGLVTVLSVFCAGLVLLMYVLQAWGLWEMLPMR
jgi:hypothetical protein